MQPRWMDRPTEGCATAGKAVVSALLETVGQQATADLKSITQAWWHAHLTLQAHFGAPHETLGFLQGM